MEEPPTQPDVAAALTRVLGSLGFSRNERMSRFLRLLVERHVEGRDSELKESLIAIEVFGRKPDYDPKQDSIVRTEATRLRARLAEYYNSDGQADRLIIEVPKGGYIPVFTARHVQAPPAPTVLPAPSSAGSSRRGWLFAAAAIGTLVLAGAGWSVARRHEPIRIAVLPLQNTSPDESGDHFADGLTDEVIRNLSVIDGLVVRSRTSSFAFKGRSVNVLEAGRELNVDYLVEGSVFRAGDQLRIDAQVVRVRDDFPVWSGRFDRPLSHVFAIQDEIALGIVNNLRLNVGRGRRRYETSIDAYDLYLRARGRMFWRSDRDTPVAIEEFKQAIAKDPQFAPAYAGLASGSAIQSTQFPVPHPAEELTTMRWAAEKALALDPLLAEAHAAAALSNARDGQWQDAEKRFRQAIALSPQDARIRMDFAIWFLAVLGRGAESLEQLRIAESLDPLSSDVQLNLAWQLIVLGRYDEANRACQKAAATDAIKWQCTGRIQMGLGRTGEAVSTLTQTPNLGSNPQARGFLGHAYARAGMRADAERMAAGTEFANEQALIFAGLGDKDRAMQALERMSAVGAQRLGRYLTFPELSLLRDDVRVKDLRRKVGLPL